MINIFQLSDKDVGLILVYGKEAKGRNKILSLRSNVRCWKFHAKKKRERQNIVKLEFSSRGYGSS